MQDFQVRFIEVGSPEAEAQLGQISARSKMDIGDVNATVAAVLARVQAEGDAAVLDYTERFDKVRLNAADLPVRKEEIEAALAGLDPQLLADLERAAASVRRFHEAQLINSQDVSLTDAHGSRVALLERPLERVGIYVPGGTAPLPSSVLMNAIPAAVAGVEEVIMCTPPNREGKIAPVILAAASLAGVTRIFRIGGAQAIAALAYGTETVPKVDKISGPGNIYVNVAKRLVYGTVDIDMFAGPSEILIIADESARASFVASDMLSQAEHDKLASAILVTDSRALAESVQKELQRLASQAGRTEILQASLRDYGAILLCRDLSEAVDLANQFAPEHLEIMVKPDVEASILAGIKNAGAIFVGEWSPEPLGDYFAGPNHVLPTSGTARFFSPLHVAQFRKKISLIHYQKATLMEAAETVERLAASEALDCHAAAVRVRREEG